MGHTSPQFTPAQLLDSGRRAEAEGKFELAVQFYRHLTDHYGQTAEAAEARNGLGRLGEKQGLPGVLQVLYTPSGGEIWVVHQDGSIGRWDIAYLCA